MTHSSCPIDSSIRGHKPRGWKPRASIGGAEMSERDGNNDRPEVQGAPPSGSPEPAFQAVLPNFDKVSRDSFKKGTVSRHRIVAAAAVFGAILVVIVGAILLTVL